MVNATPRSLYTREREPVLISEEVGWGPGTVWTGVENLAPTGIFFFKCTSFYLTLIVVTLVVL